MLSLTVAWNPAAWHDAASCSSRGDDGAFNVSYDSETPTTATITTSNHNRRYELERTPSDSGVQFSKGGVRFWTDGKRVVLEGVAAPMRNCKIKTR